MDQGRLTESGKKLFQSKHLPFRAHVVGTLGIVGILNAFLWGLIGIAGAVNKIMGWL